MKRLRRWLTTKWNSSLLCVYGFHRVCNGTTFAPLHVENCHCDCHRRRECEHRL